MSSERTEHDGRGVRMRLRLHSLGFRWFMRLFGVLLAADATRVLRLRLLGWSATGGGEDALHVLAFALIAYLLCFRARSIHATDGGLEIRSGSRLRVIPWARVATLREVSWMSLHPPWYPKRYEVELMNGDVLEFVGRRDARKVVESIRAR